MPLGWHISVYRQQTDGSAPAAFGAPRGTRLAVWQTGLGGLDWFNDLVKAQKAIDLGGNGYPMEYTAMAIHIVPRLRGDPPLAKPCWTFGKGDIVTDEWLGQTAKDLEAMNACRPDEWLVIRAWDES
jgi:hypothetical protein